MSDPVTTLAVASFAVTGVSITSIAALKAWRGWLDLRRLELAAGRMKADGRAPRPSPAARIELADLKERVRKLEAIASGIED